MYTGIKHLHSYFAYLTLAILIFALAYHFYAWIQKKSWTKKSKQIALYGMIAAHLQLLGGIALYLISPLGLSFFSASAMQNSLSRLYVLEHPLTMIIAIALITFAYVRARKVENDTSKHRTIALFYLLSLILILIRIPWHAWI